MISSKQRAYLRTMANTLNPIFQIGKGGLNENLIKSVDEALENRELIKLTILDNSTQNVKEACAYIAEHTGSEQIQCIGRRFVLYRESKEHKTILL